MDKYVYRCLKEFGNVYISEEDYKKLGEKKILADLKKHGFDCEISINTSKAYVKATGDYAPDTNIIISVK